jgi:histidine triad (HIT) family protein
MTDCLFCRIVAGEIPSTRVAETASALAFRDVSPQAPIHLLVIPKTHVQSLAEADDPAMLGELLSLAAEIARKEGLAEGGYRTVINTGTNGGQTVGHLHLHVLGGRQLHWPPG